MTGEIRGGRDPDRRYTGTPIFSAGTRLYLGEVYWGAADNAHFIGLSRNRRTLANSVVDLALVVHVRPKLIYSPGLIGRLRKLDAAFYEDEAQAREAASTIGRLARQRVQERLDRSRRPE